MPRRRPPGWVLALGLCAGATLVEAGCPAPKPREGRPADRGAVAPRRADQVAPRPTSAVADRLLAPREEGPPREEAAGEVRAARTEAAQLTRSLLAGGISRREVASIADMRGYRHFKRRRFAQARAWFLQALAADTTFELSAYNAARCAALLGNLAEARALLGRLRTRDTLLARSLLRRAAQDPDLAGAIKTDRPEGPGGSGPPGGSGGSSAPGGPASGSQGVRSR